jgi:hypothetical protein
MQILSKDILNGSFAKYYSHISGLDAAVTHSRYFNYLIERGSPARKACSANGYSYRYNGNLRRLADR